MKLLLYSGLLYLAGVASILILQPSLMFTDDGGWKEFGIGRNPDTHTWLPFWLFAMTWAVLSYIIILMIASFLPGVSEEISQNQYEQQSLPQQKEPPQLTHKNFLSGKKGKSNSLTPGYYILNREATDALGTPKYIYLGAEPPGTDD